MNPRIISIIILSLFTFSIVITPLVKIIDDSVDISMVFTLNEEEKSQKEISLDAPFEFHSDMKLLISIFEKKNRVFQKESLYSFLHHNELTQPPEVLS